MGENVNGWAGEAQENAVRNRVLGVKMSRCLVVCNDVFLIGVLFCYRDSGELYKPGTYCSWNEIGDLQLEV